MQNKLFQIEDRNPEIKRVAIADIIIPEFDPPAYMTDSIEGFGQLDEVKLVTKGKKYDVIDGRRRLATLKAAGTEYVEAKVFSSLKPHEKAMITLMSNYCRSHNVISELEALKVLEEKKIDPETIRTYLNVTKNKITQLNRLKDLPEILYKALAENRITESIAKAVANMNKKNQKKLAKIFETTGKLTGTDIRELRNKTKEEFAEAMSDDLFFNPNMVTGIVKQILALPDGEKVKLWRELETEGFLHGATPGN